MEVHFYLKEKRSIQETPIYIFFSLSGNRYKYYFGEKALPENWDFKKERLKRRRQNQVVVNEFNSMLDNIETFIKHLCRKCINDQIRPTKKLFREELDVFLFRADRKENIDLLTFLTQQVESKFETTKNIKTTRVFQNVKNKIHRFAQETGYFDFEDINLKWKDNFVNWLFLQDYSINYVVKILKVFRQFLSEAFDQEISDNRIFQNRKFSIKGIKTTSTYLTVEELKRLYNAKLNPFKSEIRDLFLIGCFTGLRVSDWSKIKPDMFLFEHGNELISVITKKSKTPVLIPVHPVVKSIVEKYNFNLPVVKVDQYINREIKKICKEVGIAQKISLVVSTGGDVQQVQKHKYELISTHTARRSFATNAVLSGVDIFLVSKILGHSKIETTRKYIQASGIEIATKVADTDFFSEGF